LNQSSWRKLIFRGGRSSLSAKPPTSAISRTAAQRQEHAFAPSRLLIKAAVTERAERVRSAHFFVASKISALTIANGSSLSEIASKFLKFCSVPLPGMVTWGTI
jgi:hypothetical protein